MEIYESNINCLKKYKKYLYNKLINHEGIQYNDDLLIETSDTRNGENTIFIEYKENLYRLNSIYNPMNEATRWVEQFEFTDLRTVLIMFGIGNGIFIRELIRKLKENDVLIIYEPSGKIFEHVLIHYHLSDIIKNPNIEIIVEELNYIEYETFLNKYIDWTNIDSTYMINHPQYDKLFPEKLDVFISKINSHKTIQIVNKNTGATLGKSIVINAIQNFKHILTSNITADYYNVFPENVPAIIVGAGPSLDKNIKELKKIKNKAVIFATDTSLKYLFAENIIPDFVITLDAKKSLNHFSDSRWENIDLLCSIESSPTILNKHTGKKIFYNTGKYLETLYQTLGKQQLPYSSGGSVATACFSVCANIGFKKIILIGQDLAYQGDVTHAGGVVLNARNTGLNTLQVEDIYGNLIKTRYDWYSFIQWFNNSIAICNEIGIEVIDATEGGAKLAGTSIMMLSEAIDKYCNADVDFSQIQKNINSSFNDYNKNIIINYFNKSLIDLMDIDKHSVEAIDICKQLIKAVKKDQLNSYQNQALVNKIKSINNLIQEKEIYSLIDDFILSVTTNELGELNTQNNSIKENQMNTYNRSIVIYKAINDAAQQLSTLMPKF